MKASQTFIGICVLMAMPTMACAVLHPLTPRAPGEVDSKADRILQRWAQLKSRNATGELLKSYQALRSVYMPANNFRARAIAKVDYERKLVFYHTPSERWGSIFDGLYDGKAYSYNRFYFNIARLRGPGGEFLRTLLRSADDYVEAFAERKYIGQEEIDGKTCDLISLLPADGTQPIDQWFDVETGYLTQQRVRPEPDTDSWDMYTRYRDYRRVDGFLFPFIEEIQIGPFDVSYTTQSVQTNLSMSRYGFLPYPSFEARLRDER